jgi:NADH:ubiquinone oxidoreductase subunit H
MTSLLFAWVGLGVVAIGFVTLTTAERRARVGVRRDRLELAPPRAQWGGGPIHPASRSLAARALAAFARLVRSRSRVVGEARALRCGAHLLGMGPLVLVVALLPVLGTWAGAEGPPLVFADLEQGLLVVAGALLVSAFARVAVGLSERHPAARLASARIASRQVSSLGLLAVVLAPLALGAGSLRLQDLVLQQQQGWVPLAGLSAQLEVPWLQAWEGAWFPAWNVFVQPITALLFVPAIALWVASPRADDPSTGGVTLAGLGLDADPAALYWVRLEARLSRVVAAGLFVTLFLGGSSIPFLDPDRFLSVLSPFVGQGLPEFVWTGLQLGTFVVKLALTLWVAARLAEVSADARDDRALRFATRRLMPLAWANLLLVAGMTIWWGGASGGPA